MKHTQKTIRIKIYTRNGHQLEFTYNFIIGLDATETIRKHGLANTEQTIDYGGARYKQIGFDHHKATGICHRETVFVRIPNGLQRYHVVGSDSAAAPRIFQATHELFARFNAVLRVLHTGDD